MIRKGMAMIVIAATMLGQITTGGVQAGFITNGGFETTTNGPGQLGYNTTATGWTTATNGYNFIYASGTADTTGSVGQYNPVLLWGPNSGSANGLTASSPSGGNFLAADGAFQVSAIQQTMTNLVVGTAYAVSFWWAGAQQSTYNGATTEQWQVSFGNSTQTTVVAQNASHGFTGWISQTFVFVADNPNDVLSFLAIGTPTGEPPFSLLDGVTVATVPEPSSVILLGLGLIGFVGFHRRRRSKALIA